MLNLEDVWRESALPFYQKVSAGNESKKIVLTIKKVRCMRKSKLIYGYGLRCAFMSMLTLFTFCGCSAHPNNANNSSKQSKMLTDSVMKAMIGDSIYTIITEAKKIKAEEIVLTNDTTNSVSKAIYIKEKYVPLVLFILSNPKNYNGNLTVYGQFIPCFKLTFAKKKEYCVLYFDFGLKKWSICDDKGLVIKKFDLPSDDMLRLANILFPENDLFKKQINIETR